LVNSVVDTFSYSQKVSVTAAEKAEYFEFAAITVKAAGAVTLPFFRADVKVENKRADGKFDPVTEADKAAETVVRDALAQAYPSHGIMGEEFGHQTGNGLTWVIDPIDGTRAFMSGMLHWGVLLALFDGETPIVGAMYQPYTDELFVGDAERAVFRRGDEQRPLHTSSCTDVSKAVLATTGVEWFDESERAQFDRLREQAQLCRIGGDCYLFGMLAMGYVHIGTDANLQSYDIQALVPIVRGAGGVITTYDGGNPSMGGTVVASANPSLHHEVLSLINNA
jgi:histidinol phosphatase-like enzyme (inositol monophosphatase family)